MFSGRPCPVSLIYIKPASVICLTLFKQAVCCAFLFELARAGSRSAARMAMMAITTRSSTSVKADEIARSGVFISQTMISLRMVIYNILIRPHLQEWSIGGPSFVLNYGCHALVHVLALVVINTNPSPTATIGLLGDQPPEWLV